MKNVLSILKSLSDRNRLRTVSALMVHDELCACEITELLGISGATVSKHLSTLANAGVVTSRKEGRWIFFKLAQNNKTLKPVFNWLKRELKEDEDILNDFIMLKKIVASDREEICRRQRGEACCPK